MYEYATPIPPVRPEQDGMKEIKKARAYIRAEIEKLQPKWRAWDESADEIKQRAQKLYEACEARNPHDITPALALATALLCQARAIRHLNDEHLNLNVPWDKRTHVPTHPAIAADAAFAQKLFNDTAPKELKGVARSFVEWAPLWEEILEGCYCGGWGRGSSSRTINLALKINHAIDVRDNALIVRQFVGVTSLDAKHLKHHYQAFSRGSQVIGDLVVIKIHDNAIIFSKNPQDMPAIKLLERHKADHVEPEYDCHKNKLPSPLAECLARSYQWLAQT